MRFELATSGVGTVAIWGRRPLRAKLQRERDGDDSFLDTPDSSIGQQYRTTFCALKHTCSSYKPTMNMDSGLSFHAPSEVFWMEDLALAVGICLLYTSDAADE